MSQRTFEQQVFAALPGTIPQIMKKSGVGRATVYLWLGILRKQSKVHISGWRRTTGRTAPYYVAGEGVDAPCPAARTNAEYHRRHYKKHRRQAEMEQRAIRKAARQNAEAMAKKPQTWISALGVGVQGESLESAQ